MRNGNIAAGQKNVKLSIITQFYPPDYAATGQLIEELAIQLGQLGLLVQVFTGQPGYAFQKKSAPAREDFEQLQVRRSRSSQIWPQRISGKAVNGLLFCIRSALHLLRTRGRGDVLLLTTAPPFLPIIGYFANLLFGLPYVCLLYDIYPDVAVELKVVPANHLSVRLWDFLNRCSWRKAKKIIVLSSTMKERIVAKCPEIADKITVIQNWANPEWIVPIAKENNWFAKEFDLVDKFTVLYSGNMGRCHDMDTIMEAAKILKDEPIKFVFIGSGAKRQDCIDQVKAWDLNCQFLPYQNKQDLPYSLTACDLSLVSVSPGMEGLVVPSKLYAALATGRPVGVICEKHSYLRELIADANCGAAVDNGDAVALAEFIRQLAADSQLAHKMGKAGRRYLESYLTPEIIAKQYSKVFYQAVLDEFPEPDSISTAAKTVPVRSKSLTTLTSAFKRHQD